MTDTPNSDQAPAADAARDALDRLHTDALFAAKTADRHASAHADAATLRDALADRITPAMARRALSWWEGLDNAPVSPSASGPNADLISYLGRIADRDGEVTA
jgi:hypothetical protein